MEYGPARPSPESSAFIRLLDLLLSVSKEELENEMKHQRQGMAKERAPEESKTLGSAR
jgi:hypothetical protein